MPREHVIEIDAAKTLLEQPESGHNRWHEEIEPLIEVDPGDTVVYETRDAFDWQLRPGSSSDAIASASLGPVHPLTGPVYVRGAEPGDLLEAELLRIEPDPWDQWGYTVEVPGFGFLRDEFPDPYIVHWRLDGERGAESEELPGVRLPFAPFPGVFGLAPSADLRRAASEREADLAERGGFALPPDRDGAVPAAEPIASEGLRTVPPRETAGNIDIKQTTPGVKLLLPVYVDGALVSTGDVPTRRATARRAEPRSRCARACTCASRFTRARRSGVECAISSFSVTTTSLRRSTPHRGASMRRPGSASGRTVGMRARMRRWPHETPC
jgi:formamidase